MRPRTTALSTLVLLVLLSAVTPAASALAPPPAPASVVECPPILPPHLCAELNAILHQVVGAVGQPYVDVLLSYCCQIQCDYDPTLDVSVVIDEWILFVEVGTIQSGVKSPLFSASTIIQVPGAYRGNVC